MNISLKCLDVILFVIPGSVLQLAIIEPLRVNSKSYEGGNIDRLRGSRESDFSSSTANEFVSSVTSPELEKNTREDIIKMIQARYPENAEAIYDEYAKLFPNDSPYGIWSVISSSRDGVFRTATTKLQQKSPVYVAWLRWYPNLMNGRMRAFHCLDICFWFNNTDLYVSSATSPSESINLG